MVKHRNKKLKSVCLVFLQWRYCIRLENLGNEVVQLRERHWRIFSLSGTLETVRGRGVVGRVSMLTNTSRIAESNEMWSWANAAGHRTTDTISNDTQSRAAIS